MAKFLPWLALGAVTLASCQAPVAQAPAGGPQPSQPDRTLLAAADLPLNRVIVKTTDSRATARAAAAVGGRVVDAIPALGLEVILLPNTDAPGAARRLQTIQGVIFAEPDFVAHVVAPPPGKGPNKDGGGGDEPTTGCGGTYPDDPKFADQWGLSMIRAQSAWSTAKSNADVQIAILDTGIDHTHEDLISKTDRHENFTTDGSTDDIYGHGTHVAGIASAATHNCKGVAGAGPDARLWNGKVLNDRGSGYYSWIANGVTWAADEGAEVINMSLGGSSDSSTLALAVDYAWGKGVVLAAAAGNDGTSSPLYPARYDNCIAVGATDETDNKASFSNHGSWVDVAAPGVNILSTMPDHRNRIGPKHYANLNGTSMATPFVAGEAAAVWPLVSGATKAERAANVRSRLERSSIQRESTAQYWTHGRIDLYNAVNGILTH